ncbi:unnamed protein product [[Candida] boidinii]|nr:unnamed protein product [[Candida] boidinii]
MNMNISKNNNNTTNNNINNFDNNRVSNIFLQPQNIKSSFPLLYNAHNNSPPIQFNLLQDRLNNEVLKNSEIRNLNNNSNTYPNETNESKIENQNTTVSSAKKNLVNSSNKKLNISDEEDLITSSLIDKNSLNKTVSNGNTNSDKSKNLESISENNNSSNISKDSNDSPRTSISSLDRDQSDTPSPTK